MGSFDDLFQPTRRENTPFDKDAWAEKKQAERASVYTMLDSFAVKMGSSGDLFRSYLDVQARFDLYSANNAILIAAQYPEATKLAGFDTWKANGVYVKRGANAIAILEPGKEYEKEDGSIGVTYNVKKVFDISQTKANLRAAPAASRDDRLLVKALMNNAPCRFDISNDLPEGVNVTYQAAKNVILVRQGLDAPAIFRGLAQELARAHMDKGGYACKNPDFAAYSVSYVLCRRNGVPVEGFFFNRLPEKYAMMDAKAVRAEVCVIRDVAGEISGDMNRLFATQEKARKSRDDGAR